VAGRKVGEPCSVFYAFSLRVSLLVVVVTYIALRLTTVTPGWRKPMCWTMTILLVVVSLWHPEILTGIVFVFFAPKPRGL
jgi:hypothetical protein